MTISLFIPCFVDLMYPQVGISMVHIFERLGHKVVVPKSPACCGQPAFNSGYWDESREIAVKMLWQFLGVLADRLDATSSELRHAKQELHAEDMSEDVTIEIFPGLDSSR